MMKESCLVLNQALDQLDRYMEEAGEQIPAVQFVELSTIVEGTRRILNAADYGETEASELMTYQQQLVLLHVHGHKQLTFCASMAQMVLQVVHMLRENPNSAQLARMIELFGSLPGQCQSALATLHQEVE